ncbi:DNA-binding transcriptional LysR family regulator [Amorphus suaedae]
MDLKTLRAFVRTVERGSLTAAASDLAISQPAVTKHVRKLETYVNARLLERTSRSVRPTASGLALYEAGRDALAQLDAALEGVRREMGEIEGTLRLFAPSCVGARQFHRSVLAFQHDHPKVSVDLVLDNREVDLVFENFDLALRYGRPAGQDTIVRRIGVVRRILVAAPDYLAREGAIRTLADLATRPLVATTSILKSGDVLQITGEGTSVDLPVCPSLRTNNADVLVNSLVAGRGPGPVQSILVEAELKSGALVRILPDYEVEPADLFLAYPSSRYMRPVVRAFIDHLVPNLQAVEGIA